LLGLDGRHGPAALDEVADNINRFVRGEPLINVVTTT